jgi:hypothetical protein
LGAGLTGLLIVVAGFTTIAIHGFRKRLREGENPNEPVLSKPVEGT